MKNLFHALQSANSQKRELSLRTADGLRWVPERLTHFSLPINNNDSFFGKVLHNEELSNDHSPGSTNSSLTAPTTAPDTMIDLCTQQQTPPLPWWKRLANKVLGFRFMVHDRWANVLFLHWRLPAHLETILEENTAPFVVDRHDGSAWIGLILLTEENVGPSVGRSQWTCLTHHGVNVRTYVRGCDETTRGIHFSSLECNDEFTAFGANLFGMPYRVAEMKRSYASGHDDASSSEEPTTILSNRCYYKMQSRRLPSSTPSLIRIFFHSFSLNCWWSRFLHYTKTIDSESSNSSPPNAMGKIIRKTHVDSSSQRFKIDCSWSRSEASDKHVLEPSSNTIEEETFYEWAIERYFVYTHKYGQRWRGKVDHEPWPVEESTIRLESLEISGTDAYEPKSMRPILRHMAKHRPDHVGFSEGVGPVLFTMLQPV